MTLPHGLARVLLAEQLYRAASLHRGPSVSSRMTSVERRGHRAAAASISPRAVRADSELLRQLGVDFEELRAARGARTRDRDVVESAAAPTSRAAHYVERIARTKAAVGWERMAQRRLPPQPCSRADTDGRARRRDPRQARDATRRRGDARPRCRAAPTTSLTAVALRAGRACYRACRVSQVTIPRAQRRDEIARYVATGEPFDKAGAYAIQGRAGDVRRAHRGQLLGRHGPAAVRDGADPASRSVIPCYKRRGLSTASQERDAMSHEILINVTPQETPRRDARAGRRAGAAHRALERARAGRQHLSRARRRVLPGMQSAFIEIGLERAAFLHVADIWEQRQNGHDHDSKPIERILHEGQALLVQVIKDPIGTKGARLSTQVSLAGRLLVYLPQDSHIGISQRIEDEAERELLREKLQHLLPAGTGTAASSSAPWPRRRPSASCSRHRVPDQAVARPDGEALATLPRAVAASTRTSISPSACCATWSTRKPRASSSTRARRSCEMQRVRRAVHAGNIVERIEHYTGERPLFDLHGVEDEIEKALGAPRRSQVRRLSHHRPDRGDDDDRRQHRRLRRRPQLRRHDLQDQPRGGAGDRAPAAAAQPRRHHHHRLHRHGERGPPRHGAGRVQQGAARRTARG